MCLCFEIHSFLLKISIQPFALKSHANTFWKCLSFNCYKTVLWFLKLEYLSYGTGKWKKNVRYDLSREVKFGSH